MIGAAVAAVVGLIAALAIARAAYQVGSRPGGPDRPGWIGERWLRDSFGVPSIPAGRRTWYLGIVVLGGAWIVLVTMVQRLARVDWRPRLRLGAVVTVVVLWAAPFVFCPPVGSRDAYSYVAHGELAAAGLDPGSVSPRDGLDFDSLAYRSVDVTWRGVVSAYGPLATGLSEVAVRAADHDMVASVLYQRLWVVIGLVLMGAGLVRLARERAPDVVLAVALASPITVVHLVGGAHNEALMMGLAVTGLAVASVGRRRQGPARWAWWAAGVVLVGLGAAVKVTVIVAAAYLGWTAPAERPSVGRRLGFTALAGAIALATIGVVSLVAGSGWGWVTGAGAGGKVFTLLSVSTTVGALIARPFYDSQRAIQLSPVLAVTRTVAFAASGVIAAVLLWRSPVLGVNALAWALLAIALLGPAVHPWYLAWGLPLLALQHQGRAEPWLMAASVVAAFSARPGGGGAWPNLGVQPWRLLVVAGVALVAILIWRGRGRIGVTAALGPAPAARTPAPSDLL